MLTELHQAGIQLSIDDFGIGQSSLAYLKDLPVSKMKVDKSFVMGFREARNAAIVRSAIELAHNLGLQVTAEGVENEDACRELKTLGCDLAQGYYFAKPMPVEQITAWLKESPWGLRA
jgi:EAL domain-containing protein (putative c-di-GMP-specific phosphodiesterase class I)